MGDGGEASAMLFHLRERHPKTMIWAIGLLLSRFMPVRTFLYEVIHVQYLVTNKFLSNHTGISEITYQQYYASVLEWSVVFFSVKGSPAVYAGMTSF